MTIINFKVDEKKKIDIEEMVRIKGYKSISEFIREAIDEKMNLQKIIDDFLEKNPPLDKEKIEIPDFIPDGKYLGISRNTIVSIGDTLGEAMEKLYEKFPKSAAGIIRKGKEMEHFETIFSLFSPENTKCMQQAEIDNNYYPILEFNLIVNENKKKLFGLIDTGASIVAIDEEVIKNSDLKPIRTTEIMTANGIIQAPIYKSKIQYNDLILDMEFTSSNIKGLPINGLLGKNFIDKFNLLLLGNEKLFCLQTLN